VTFYINNGAKALPMPKINLEKVSGVGRGLDLEGPKMTLRPTGYVMVEE
jgi:hypothetical protein